MRVIHTVSGRDIMVDDEDYPVISLYKWQGSSRYAIRHTSRSTGRKTVFMHREIMGAKPNQRVDHVNGNTFDNRKSNLRLATVTENNWNAKTRKDNTSGYKGVHWREKHKDYVVYINVNKKRLHLKTYKKFEDAVRARKEAEAKYHGDFAFSGRV